MSEDGKQVNDGRVVPSPAAERLIGKSWAELEVLEHADYLLFPASIYKCRRDGQFDAVDVMLRVPRQHEMRKARVDARNLAKKAGLDPSLDRDLVDDLETICILSMAIRNSTPPHEPMVPDPEELEKMYDRASLMQVWAKLDELFRVINPAPHEISEEEMFALIAAIAKERNISPLHAYAADSQARFVVFMAGLLQSSQESKSS